MADLDSIVEALDQKRRQYEFESNYEEAERTKQRLEQLQKQVEQKRIEDMKSEQLTERLGVEEAHMKELQEFNQHWDQKASEFEQHAESLQLQLKDRHEQEFAQARQKFEEKTAPRERWSRELLNLWKIQETLAKMKKYAEAAKMKAQAEMQKEKEKALWDAKRRERIRALEEKLKEKQILEYQGLTKRIVSGREEQKQARKLELERLLQRYHNVKSQLESQHKIATLRYQRQTPRLRTAGDLSHSMSIGSSRYSYVRG